jgi:LPXTG-site transpeptidase (sortase) family protein
MSVVYRKAPVPGRAAPVTKAVYKKPHHGVFGRQFRSNSRWSRVMPAALVTIGSVLIANVAWPILSFQLFSSPMLQKEKLTAPIGEDSVMQYQPAVAPVQAVEEKEAMQQGIQSPAAPQVITDELDYTNLATWFPNLSMPDISRESAKTYLISIPAVKVEKAEVRIGGLNLDKNLIQYPGTANPGQLGSPIIFGHSVSPLFYNPSVTNPRRYTSIFTKIMELKKNDKIIVEYDGITYTYSVTNKTEVKPDDTYILEQRYDTRELKLVTCTPPGTYLRRGIVFAQLEDFQ